MQSDFFKPYNDLMTEAHIFCNHATAKDWFWYFTGRTISNVMMSTEDLLIELEWIEDHLFEYVMHLTQTLEGYERFEMCKRVTVQLDKFSQEIEQMYEGQKRLR